MLRQGIGEFIEMGPEQLLPQVARRTAGKAADPGIRGDRLQRSGVVGGEAPVTDQPGGHLHLSHLRTGGQGPHQLQDVGGLTAGVGIAAQLQVTGSKQTVQVQVQNMETTHGG